MTRPLPRPAQRYVCSALGCNHGHAGMPYTAAFAEGVYTIEQQVLALRNAGWRAGMANATCPGCWTRETVSGAMASVTSLESALRASLREPVESAPLATVTPIARRVAR